jgi:hypothetical protein
MNEVTAHGTPCDPKAGWDSINPLGATGIEAEVCADIARRQRLGIAKYGTTVAENPLELKEWLQHALEENYDYCVYLKRAIQEIDSITAERDKYRAMAGELIAAVRMNAMRGTFANASFSEVEDWLKQWVDKL